MKTAGEILKNQRSKKNWTLEKVSGLTRIQLNVLKAIEDDNLASLPKSPFVFGLVRNYAKSLGLNSEEVLAIFRREYNLRTAKNLVPPQPLSGSLLFLGNLLSWRFLFVMILTAFLGILVFEYIQFSRSPFLIVSTPTENQTVESLSLKVSGKTDSGNQIFVNGEKISVSTDGSFEVEVNLKEGENVLLIMAQNQLNKTTQIKRTVLTKISH